MRHRTPTSSSKAPHRHDAQGGTAEPAPIALAHQTAWSAHHALFPSQAFSSGKGYGLLDRRAAVRLGQGEQHGRSGEHGRHAGQHEREPYLASAQVVP